MVRSPEWTLDRLLATRMANQGLGHHRLADAVAVARRTLGVQAQDVPATHLAMRSRSSSVTLADSVRSIEAPATVVRTWLMRGTLHAIAVGDARWLTDLFGPALVAKYRTRRAGIGLTDQQVDRAADALPAIISGRSLTRGELAEALARAGAPVADTKETLTHLTLVLAGRGLICRGPDRGRQPTFAATDWLPAAAPVPTESAYRDLARRYLAAFGPASADDFVAWAGLPARPARAGFDAVADETRKITVAGRELWLLGPTSAPPRTGALRLLSGWDTYVLGYRNRDAFLAPGVVSDLGTGGWIHPSVVLDGRIIGTWRIRRTSGNGAAIRVGVAVDLTAGLREQIDAEVADIARFYGQPARWEPVAEFH